MNPEIQDNQRGDFEKKPVNINEIKARILDELEKVAIKPQDIDSGGNFLAFPEGPRSNLNERNWKIVRTKSFKEWFGDWQEKKDCSMVVDENGEPKVVTHRTHDEDEIILQPPRKEFSVTSRFMHFTSQWVGEKPNTWYGENIHLAFLNIRKLFNGQRGLPYYDYPDSKKAGFINCIDDDFLKWLLKNGYDGAYDPGTKRGESNKKEAVMYTDEYVPLNPQEQVLFIDIIKT